MNICRRSLQLAFWGSMSVNLVHSVATHPLPQVRCAYIHFHACLSYIFPFYNSLSFLIGMHLVNHTPSQSQVCVPTIASLAFRSKLFYLKPNARVSTSFGSEVPQQGSSLACLHFQMNVLSPPSPNNVAPYYLQVYTSSVNDLILSLAIFTPHLQDLHRSDHHPRR